MFLRLIIYISTLLCISALATESDNYTSRSVILKKDNAAPVIENLVNALIHAAITETNALKLPKDKLQERLREALRKRLASDSFGILAAIVQSQSPFRVYGVPVTPLEWVLDQQNITKLRPKRSSGLLDIVARPSEKTLSDLNWGKDFDELLKTQFPLNQFGERVLLKDSIYSKLNIFESGLSGMPGIMFVASINLNGSVVGIDKLGHFFAQGYSYYESQNSGRKLEDILRDGKIEEETFFGSGLFGIPTFGSGVVSYADLSANFYGLQFWSSLFGGTNPYLKVRSGKLVKLRGFQFKDYPVYSWDEAINISNHHGLIAEDVRKAISKLGLKWNEPADPKKASALHSLNCASFYTARSLKIKSKCRSD